MKYFEVLKSGLMTSIQDMGRTGLAYYALPTSGVMDKNAAKIALLLLHKNEDTPIIECAYIAPELQFHAATKIALTGADFEWKINEKLVPLNTILQIQKGDILTGSRAKDKLRGYIALEGALSIEKVYDSFSTYSSAQLGGFQGRFLQKKDRIEWTDKPTTKKEVVRISIQKGPEYDCLSTEAKQHLVSAVFAIHSDSNRMGARLEGFSLMTTRILHDSVPVLPGFIQVPPSGFPIVVLQDGQTTGGYPRVAYIREAHLSVFNQIPLGGKLCFKLI